MVYTKKLMKHFKNPKNMGKIANPDGVAVLGNPICGDVMKMYIKIGIKNPSKKAGKQEFLRQSSGQARIKNPGEKTSNNKTMTNEEFIKDIRFQTLGCASAIATSSVVTQLAKGKSLDQALKIDKQMVADELGGLPLIKMHCSLLAVEALHKAIKNYKEGK